MTKLLRLFVTLLLSCQLTLAFVPSPNERPRRVNFLSSGGPDDDDTTPLPSTPPIPFDARSTATILGGQSSLIILGPAVGALAGTPNYGLGAGFSLDLPAIGHGFLWTIPLAGLVVALEFVEPYVPALKKVTRATFRSVLVLLGGTFDPIAALIVATALGLAAGIGEEWLFRGVLQTELISSLSLSTPLAVGISSLIFGALHAVTPLYAFLATIASVYFGCVMLWSDQNVLVPMATHAIYDFGALLFAHWQVCNLSTVEQNDIMFGSLDPMESNAE